MEITLLILIGCLLIGGAIITSIVSIVTRKDKPAHFDRVLEEAEKLANTGRREHAINLLSSETQRLAKKEKRSDELDVRLARLRFAHGRLLEAAGRRDEAIQQLRAAVATPSAESSVIDHAIVLLMHTRTTAPQDLKLFLEYLSLAPNRIAEDDPFVLALDEAHYRQLLQDGATRDDAMAFADRLRAKGVSLAWMLRAQAPEWVRSGAKERAIAALENLVGNKRHATRDDRRLLAQLLVEEGSVKAGFDIYCTLAEEADASTADMRAAGRTALQQYESAKLKSAAVLTTAAQWLTRAIEADANDAPTWVLLGRVHALLRQMNDARRAYERALECGADDAPIRMALVEILLEQKLPALALPHLRRAAEITATSGELWVRSGKLALEIGDENTALHAFESAVACAPTLVDAVLMLAKICHRRGDHARVVALLEHRSNLPPDMLPMISRSLAHIGNTEQAIQRLSAYAKAHRTDQRIRLELGMLHGRLGEWANAGEQFASITDAAMRETALPYHAYVCLRSGDSVAAAKLAAKARAAGMDSALLHHVTAALALTNKDVAHAREEWKTTLRLDPKFAPALHGMARLCEAEKDYAAAATWYAQLREAEPTRRDAVVRHGVCLTRAGRYAEAIVAFDALGADLDAHVEALECAAHCHAKLLQWKEAAAALEKLPKTGKHAAAKQRSEFVIRYEYARRLYQNGAYEQALQQLDLLPANQLGQASVTRAMFAAQTAVVGQLLPPRNSNALHDALQRLRRIAPASFAARVVPALLELAQAGRPPQWSSIADVRPTNAAQQTALAILAATAGESEVVQSLLIDSSHPIGLLLRGIAAAQSQQWTAAFDALHRALRLHNANGNSLDALIRLTAACGIASGNVADVRTMLETLASNQQAMRILGVLATAEGRMDEASRLLSTPNIDGAGAADARQLVAWRRFIAIMQSGDHAAAAAALERTSPEIRSHPSFIRAQLDLRMRSIETSASDAARRLNARQSLRMIAPELLTPPRDLRRAAIAATQIAAQNVGVRADVIADHRLAAALWATALEGPYMWDALDRERAQRKQSTLPIETREKLKITAKERLLASMRSNAGRGWTKNEVDLGCAWIEYEFTCAMLFEKSGVGYGLSTWPKGLAAAPMLLMEDTLEEDHLESYNELREVRAAIIRVLAEYTRGIQQADALKSTRKSSGFEVRNALKTARATILDVLAEHRREYKSGDKKENAVKIAVYIVPKSGFAEFLLDTDRPHLALSQMKSGMQSDATLRGRALVAQALKLSASPTSVADALQMFEQAAALKTSLVPHRSAIIDAAVAVSRNVLNSHASNPAAALQPLDVGTRLAGKAAQLDQGRAAVFVQQALNMKNGNDVDGAVRKLREALALHDDEPTRMLQVGLLRDQSTTALMKRNHQEALNTMRECVRLEEQVAEQDVDYRARCELQMEMINFGTDIATKKNASIRDLRTAVKAGEDAMWFLKDSDSDKFLGAALFELGRRLALDESWTEAISSLEASLRYRNDDNVKRMLGIALYVRGAKAYDSGNRSSGSADLKRAYQLHPEDDDIRRAYFLVVSQGW